MRNDFERISPEQAGIPSGEILAYMQELCAERLCLHDLMIFRGGRLIYEAYWKPMDRSFLHRQYSCSKSFTSVAVGAAIGEGLLRLDSRVKDFFPDKVPGNLHPYLERVTIRDLLRMSTCFTWGAYYKPSDPDWADTWFRAKPSHAPGRVFNYDTAGTTMLCMILRRVTGMEMLDYLRRKVLDPIGFDPEGQSFCVETPCGHHWGGSGVVCTNYDFARFALFCMNYGRWDDHQLVPEDYMRAATSKQIDIQLDQSDRKNCGYGYQFWILPEGGFSMNGMGCQFAVCYPKQELLLVTHGYEELASIAKPLIFEGFARHILPCVNRPLPEDAAQVGALQAFTDGLRMAVPEGAGDNPLAERFGGQTFRFEEENDLGWRTARFSFGEQGGSLLYENATGSHRLDFAFGGQARQPFPETHYFGRRIGQPGGRGYNCFVSAAWAERTCDGCCSDTLAVWCQICDTYLAELRMEFCFGPGELTVRMRNHAEWFLEGYSGFAAGVSGSDE